MNKNLVAEKFDYVIEVVSAIAIVVVALVVFGGFSRLVLQNWEYVIPAVGVVIGGVYLVKKSKF